MRFIKHAIDGIVEVIPSRLGDKRGYFSETFKRSAFVSAGIDCDWVQDNDSYSEHAGTVRGLHFQTVPKAQAKLVRVVRGAIFDVAVDIRRGSPSYGRWVGVELSRDKWNQLFVPVGFAHGFMTLQPATEVLYKVDALWSAEHEQAIAWDDPTLAIGWPLSVDAPSVSDKDMQAKPFATFETPFLYSGG